MDIKDIQQKSEKELVELVVEKRTALRDLRFKGAGSGMRDSKAAVNTRKTIARALTVLNEKARASAEAKTT
jgi:ribosomal protein L29